MQENGTSFFGAKVDGMVKNAKEVSNGLNFTSRIEATVDDLWSVISIAINAVAESGENTQESDRDDHFTSPSIEDHSGDEEKHEEISEISVDDLIAESYTHGKTDEEIAEEFKNDLKSTVRHFAWIFVSIGIALDHEEKTKLVETLKIQARLLANKARSIKEREDKLKGLR